MPKKRVCWWSLGEFVQKRCRNKITNLFQIPVVDIAEVWEGRVTIRYIYTINIMNETITCRGVSHSDVTHVVKSNLALSLKIKLHEMSSKLHLQPH